MKKVIGLTGGIASGKSTVVEFLLAKGYQVIDADKVVRELQSPSGRLNQAIFERFGSEFFDENRNLLRQKLGQLIFSDEVAKSKLAEIQGRVIRKELYDQLDQLLAQAKENEIIFMDIPLLLEAKYTGFDEIWLVAVDEETQIARIMARDGWSREEAVARIHSQMSLVEKKKLATRIIENAGTIEETRATVEKYLDEIR